MMDFYGPIELETEDSEEFLDGFFGIFLHFWDRLGFYGYQWFHDGFLWVD